MQVTGNKTLHSYDLSIRVSADGFSFITRRSGLSEVVQRDNFVVGASAEMARAMRDALMRPKLLDRDYQCVTVEVDGPCTRVPLEEFRREEVATFYQLAFASLDMAERSIRYEICPGLEMVELFSIQRDVEDAILQTYPDATFSGLYGAVMQEWLQEEARHHAGLYVYEGGEQMLLFAFAEGRLTFANTYEMQNNADRQYFILYAWKTLDLSQEADRLVLIGGGRELCKMLEQFVVHVETVEA